MGCSIRSTGELAQLWGWRTRDFQLEESETWIGKWMASRKNRDQIVTATNFTTTYPAPGQFTTAKIMANYQGHDLTWFMRVHIGGSALERKDVPFISFLLCSSARA